MTRMSLQVLLLLLLGLALWPDSQRADAAPRRIVCDRAPAPVAVANAQTTAPPVNHVAAPAGARAAARAATGPVAVIFPREKEPYRSAFLSVVGGLRETLGARAEVQEVDKGETANDIAARISARDAGTVVLLGPYGLEVARGLDQHLDRVIGAVPARPGQLPEGARGISVLPAPRSLFQKLRELAPGAKRIAVVHGGDANDWLIERAASEAAALGYTFVALKRDTLSDGAKAYRELFDKELHSPADALWLPPGSPFVKEDSVMEMIVSKAWNQNIVVFSSSGSHVQRGTLFALVLDNTEMGRALGRMASSPPQQQDGLQLLEEFDTAINIRTANHLGLALDAADPRFDLVFPNR